MRQDIYFFVFSFISVVRKNIINSSLRLSILILSIYGAVLWYLDANKDRFFDSFQQDILVEAHGLLFDLIVIAIIFEVFKKGIINNNQIKSLKSSLSDYKISTSTESKYFIINTLRRLFEMKSVHIEAGNLDLSDAKFEHLNFLFTDFNNSNLSKTSFLYANFFYCDFSETILHECDFSGCNIRFSEFKNCKNIDKAIFAETHITDDCKSYLESILSGSQLRNIIWTDSKVNFQDLKACFKASINVMDNLMHKPRKEL